ncbi:hypothetical protein TcBrA4_0028280 [Trypanosoma cruzi]|nr:hypothetical protein TcBrA4_0028280 [Trypanosoma cruzi]
MNICACGCGCAISLVVFFLSSLFCASDRSSHNEDIPPQCPPVKAASRSLSRLPRRSARMTTRRTLLLSKGCVNSRGPRRRPSLSLRAAGSKGLLPWPPWMHATRTVRDKA